MSVNGVKVTRLLDYLVDGHTPSCVSLQVAASIKILGTICCPDFNCNGMRNAWECGCLIKGTLLGAEGAKHLVCGLRGYVITPVEK